MTPTTTQLRACIEAYGSTSQRGELAAEVLRLREALTVAEDGLATAVRALRPNDQRTFIERSLRTVRAALNMVDR